MSVEGGKAMPPSYEAFQHQRARLARLHGADLLQPVESCGVGLVAEIDGKASRRVVDLGIKALGALSHRGAVDADGKSGDGAGIHFRIPQEFFRQHIERAGHSMQKGRLAIGMVFLPRRSLRSRSDVAPLSKVM